MVPTPPDSCPPAGAPWTIPPPRPLHGSRARRRQSLVTVVRGRPPEGRAVAWRAASRTLAEPTPTSTWSPPTGSWQGPFPGSCCGQEVEYGVSAAAPGPFPDLSAALESERDAWCAHLLRQAELLLVKVQGRDSGRGDCVQELDAHMTRPPGPMTTVTEPA
jgi:hypothetical protein